MRVMNVPAHRPVPRSIVLGVGVAVATVLLPALAFAAPAAGGATMPWTAGIPNLALHSPRSYQRIAGARRSLACQRACRQACPRRYVRGGTLEMVRGSLLVEGPPSPAR
jgi:hypothetical protein